MKIPKQIERRSTSGMDFRVRYSSSLLKERLFMDNSNWKFHEIKSLYEAKKASLNEGEKIKLFVYAKSGQPLDVRKVTVTEFIDYQFATTFTAKYGPSSWKNEFEFCPGDIDYSMSIWSGDACKEDPTPDVEFETVKYKKP